MYEALKKYLDLPSVWKHRCLQEEGDNLRLLQLGLLHLLPYRNSHL